jgi:predicted nucleic acid-binding protein
LIYFDASVLVSLLVADAHTDKASAWYSGLSATVVVSDLANLEVSAVLSRHLRVGRLTQGEVESSAGLRRHARQLRTAEPRRRRLVVGRARCARFLDQARGGGRATLASVKNLGAALATFDSRLGDAARMKAVAVVELE